MSRAGAMFAGTEDEPNRGSVMIDSEWERGRHIGLLANTSRNDKNSDSLPSCTTATPVSMEPRGRRDAALPGPAHLAVSTRPSSPRPMASPNAAIRHALPRGVYYDLYPSHREFYAECGDGRRLPRRTRVPIGSDEEVAVILDLAAALDDASPLPPADASPSLASAWPPLQLVRSEALR